MVRQLRPIPPLRFHPRMEPQICEADSEPSHETSYCRHVCEPAEDASRAFLDPHVCKDGEESTEDDGDVREPVFRCLQEYPGRVSRSSQAI